ncbi:DNA polymerase III subunit epsilon [Lichenifustis flavocetrariae]|uniref:DNA polymerase III subunit epsilon n=1 Tax=Lichenifustis flavocetrariae TaxID=2949735 RepID=A0AA41YXP6_9HYPH|nr:DNA polymerase III subunit epsilon [Lichenifustis flavocetrariae]MCW6506833.1 DNA polymerase III subunit epsilon [Lichenifustis flavocetrariae]
MREIVLDTETTGLDPKTGDRLVEIAGVELINSIPTGRHYHTYINPERDMPEGAFKVHGLSAEFLSAHRLFAHVADEFLAFVEGAKLVIHNAEFDMRFINHELGLLGRSAIGMEHVIDTLAMARRKHPGAPASLDALCVRYKIDNSKRTKHGALIDAEILADVYLELLGGRQTTLGLGSNIITLRRDTKDVVRQRPVPLPSALTDAEREAHAAFIATMGGTPLWANYASVEAVRDASVAAV